MQRLTMRIDPTFPNCGKPSARTEATGGRPEGRPQWTRTAQRHPSKPGYAFGASGTPSMQANDPNVDSLDPLTFTAARTRP